VRWARAGRTRWAQAGHARWARAGRARSFTPVLLLRLPSLFGRAASGSPLWLHVRYLGFVPARLAISQVWCHAGTSFFISSHLTDCASIPFLACLPIPSFYRRRHAPNGAAAITFTHNKQRERARSPDEGACTRNMRSPVDRAHMGFFIFSTFSCHLIHTC
jgi:hypothetical protein